MLISKLLTFSHQNKYTWPLIYDVEKKTLKISLTSGVVQAIIGQSVVPPQTIQWSRNSGFFLTKVEIK